MRFARNLSLGASLTLLPLSWLPVLLCFVFSPHSGSSEPAVSSPKCGPTCPSPPGALDMSKQATQECLSGETLKLAARAGQGVGGPVLKSGSLELHSVE